MAGVTAMHVAVMLRREVAFQLLAEHAGNAACSEAVHLKTKFS